MFFAILRNVSAFQRLAEESSALTHLQHEAEVGGGLVLALEVLAVVDVEVVELDEADEVAGGLRSG